MFDGENVKMILLDYEGGLWIKLILYSTGIIFVRLQNAWMIQNII